VPPSGFAYEVALVFASYSACELGTNYHRGLLGKRLTSDTI